ASNLPLCELLSKHEPQSPNAHTRSSQILEYWSLEILWSLGFGIRRSGPVVSDRFDRAAFHCFLATSFFLGILRLFVNVGMPSVIVAFEIRGRRFAAEIAINALLVDVKLSGSILRIFVCRVGHIYRIKWSETLRRNGGRRNGI